MTHNHSLIEIIAHAIASTDLPEKSYDQMASHILDMIYFKYVIINKDDYAEMKESSDRYKDLCK